MGNPKFESYKLDFDDDEDAKIQRIKLPAGAALVGRTLLADADLKLGFKEARNRAKWNHFTPGPDLQAGYIDADGTFWIVEFADVSPQRIERSGSIETPASDSSRPVQSRGHIAATYSAGVDVGMRLFTARISGRKVRLG